MQTKTIPIPASYKCAAEINKSNWDMAGLPHATCGDRFETTVSGDKLTVKRIDAGGLDGHGWGMKLQFRCSDGPVLATCGGNGGGGHGWKKLSTTNIGVRTGVYVDKFSGMGGNGGGSHELNCGSGYRIHGYNTRCGSLVDRIQLKCRLASVLDKEAATINAAADKKAAAEAEERRIEAARKAAEEKRAAEEKAEAERIAKEKAAKAEADRKRKEAEEAARIAKEKAEKEEAERKAEAERKRKEAEEAARIAKEKAEKAEAERIAKEKAEADRIAKEKAEKAEADRIAKEKAEKAAADKAEADRIAREKAEKEAIAKAEEEAAAKLQKEMEAEVNAAKEEVANHIDGTESKLFVVGSQSGKQTKTITIPAGYKCAAEINKSTWDMAGLPHATCGDRFETTVSGDQLTVK